MTELKLPCGRVVLIDLADVPILEGYRLHSEARGRTRYVRLRKPGQRGGGQYLHNVLTGGRADHRNGDGLDNRRSNLRPCTQAQNGLNKAPKKGKQFKGVYRHRSGRFYAQAALNGHVTSSGSFDREEDAARAYDDMARALHGVWARLNFPDRVDGRQGEMPL